MAEQTPTTTNNNSNNKMPAATCNDVSTTSSATPQKDVAQKVKAEVEEVKQKKVVNKVTFGEITLHEFEGVEEVSGASMVQSFPGVGITSTITCNYMVDHLKLPTIGVITCKRFPSRVVISNGQPTHGARILGNSKLVAILCEFKISQEVSDDLCELIMDFAQRRNIKNVICIESLPVQKKSPTDSKAEDTDMNPIHYITSNKQFFDCLKEKDLKQVTSGMMDGVTGGILARSSYCANDVKVLVLLAEVSARDPGAKSAAYLSALLTDLLKLDVDSSPLEEQANTLQDKVNKLIKSETEVSSSHSPMYL